jgi:hypothetical protein
MVMDAIKLRSHVGADGILKLEVPVGVKNIDLDVVVNVAPVGNGAPAKTPEELGWPEGFFEETAGSIPDFPQIDSEGDFEVRKPIL